MQHQSAEQACTGADARLCTALELEWDATRGAGCQLDRACKYRTQSFENVALLCQPQHVIRQTAARLL